MFTLLRTVPAAQLLTRQFPALALSLLIAELFYKFHSFVLECAAFLVTWFVIDFFIESVTRLIRGAANRKRPADSVG